MDGADSLRTELAASIDRTLVAEARRNELTIARVRVATMVGLLGIEAWLVVGGSALGNLAYPMAAGTVAMAVWSVILMRAMANGWWAAWLPIVVPLIDTVYVAARQGASLYAVGVRHFADVQDLSTITAFAGVLTLTGAFRLTERSVLFAAGLGLVLYLGFALNMGLHRFFISVHVLLLGATAMAATGLTRIVTRAVQSEVTRLTLSRLLPAPVLDAADADPLALLSEPRSVDATIVITDLRGFTRWAEHKQPLEVLGFLNTVQGSLAEVVLRHGGTVDKFMGDGMLAVFGAPEPLADHAERAVVAAREMLDVVERLGEVRLGVGIHSGEVVVGCLGSGVRMEFTVLGDTVNTASRLEAATKEHQVSSLVSAATVRLLDAPDVTRVGEVPIRGRDQTLEVFSLNRGSPAP